MTFSGIALVLAGIGVAALGIVTFIGLFPLGVLDADGRPGADAIGSASAPGSMNVDLDAGTRYAVWLLVPSGSSGVLDALPTVSGPGGGDVHVSATTQVSSQMTQGGTSARTVAGFRASDSGGHTLVVPGSSPPGAMVMVTEDQPIGPFISGIFGTVAGALAAVLLGILGAGLTIGGGIWWAMRRNRGTVGGPVPPPPAPVR